MKFANKFCRDLHKSYTLGFGLLETRINTEWDSTVGCNSSDHIVSQTTFTKLCFTLT